MAKKSVTGGFNQMSCVGTVLKNELSINDSGDVIRGNFTVLADGAEVKLNVYAAATYKSGASNESFKVLRQIMNLPAEELIKTWVSVQGGVRSFYYVKPGEVAKTVDDLSYSLQFSASFISFVTDPSKQVGGFSAKVDVMLNRMQETEADDDKQMPAKTTLYGYMVDTYKNRFMPFYCETFMPEAIDYFNTLGLAYDNPAYMMVKLARKPFHTKVVQEGAFGEQEVIEVNTTRTACVWASKPYEVDKDIPQTSIDEWKKGLEAWKKETMDKENKKNAGAFVGGETDLPW